MHCLIDIIAIEFMYGVCNAQHKGECKKRLYIDKHRGNYLRDIALTASVNGKHILCQQSNGRH